MDGRVAMALPTLRHDLWPTVRSEEASCARAPAWKTHAMLLDLTDRQAHALFGSMYAVATLGGTEALSEMAASAIESLAVVASGARPSTRRACRGDDRCLAAPCPRQEAEAAVEIWR